jgi:PilZ domain
MDNAWPAAATDPVVPPDNEHCDQRDGQRLRAVCRIAKVLRVDDAGLWLVRNISNGGMMLSTNVAVEPGEPITIALSDSIHLDAEVAWVKDGKCGVTFAKEVNGPVLLKQLADEQAAKGYRAPRIPVKSSAKASINNKWQPIELVNLSQNGVGFLHDGTVTVGTQMVLMLGDVERKAIVRWSRGRAGGLWLTQPLARAEMESIKALQSSFPPYKSSARRL